MICAAPLLEEDMLPSGTTFAADDDGAGAGGQATTVVSQSARERASTKEEQQRKARGRRSASRAGLWERLSAARQLASQRHLCACLMQHRCFRTAGSLVVRDAHVWKPPLRDPSRRRRRGTARPRLYVTAAASRILGRRRFIIVGGGAGLRWRSEFARERRARGRLGEVGGARPHL